VAVHQRYDGTELDKPVTATLIGPKSLEPAGQAQPAPAMFTYTAGPNDNDSASVTFKSVSNRGIGETSIGFEVGGSWHINQAAAGGLAVKGQKCGGLDGLWTFVGTIKSSQIDQTTTWNVTLNGTTLQGTYTYKSVTKSYPSIVTTGIASGRASIVEQTTDGNGYLAGTLHMTIVGTMVRETVVGAGGEVTVSVPIPDGQFAWSPGASCH